MHWGEHQLSICLIARFPKLQYTTVLSCAVNSWGTVVYITVIIHTQMFSFVCLSLVPARVCIFYSRPALWDPLPSLQCECQAVVRSPYLFVVHGERIRFALVLLEFKPRQSCSVLYWYSIRTTQGKTVLSRTLTHSTQDEGMLRSTLDISCLFS